MTKLITNFKELDEFVREYRTCGYKNCTEREFFASHQLDFVSFTRLFGSVPPEADPFSSDYADWEMKFFEFLSGQPYDFHNEGLLMNETRMDINAEQYKSQPPQIELPLITKINLYKTYADILQFTSPRAGQRVLEMGCGGGGY
jgi:hypothetical protein